MQRGSPTQLPTLEEVSQYTRLKARCKDEILLRLANPEGVNQCLEERRSVFYQGKPVNYSECLDLGVFLEDGSLNPEVKDITIENERILPFLRDLLGPDNLAMLTLRDQVILEAVLFSVQFQFFSEFQASLMDKQGMISAALAKDSGNKKLQRELDDIPAEMDQVQSKANTLLRDLMHELPISGMISTLVTNRLVYPQAAAAQSLVEYITFLQRAGLWHFYVPPESISMEHAYSRTFNDIPLPPYLSPLMDEISSIIRHPDDLEANLSIWASKVMQIALLELFDEKGLIRENLFNQLPKTAFPLDRNDEKLKITLLQAYMTSVITENVTSILSKAENREAAHNMVKETLDLGEDDFQEVETPLLAFVNKKLQSVNIQIRQCGSICEVRDRMSKNSQADYHFSSHSMSVSSSRMKRSDSDLSNSSDDEAVPFIKQNRQSGGGGQRPPEDRSSESIPVRQAPKPGLLRSAWNSVKSFFRRHWKAITISTAAFATAGGLAGAVVGFVAGFSTGPFSLIASPLAALILGGIGFAGGAVVGFVAGVTGSLIADAVSSPAGYSPVSTRVPAAPENGSHNHNTTTDLLRKTPPQQRRAQDSGPSFTSGSGNPIFAQRQRDRNPEERDSMNAPKSGPDSKPF